MRLWRRLVPADATPAPATHAPGEWYPDGTGIQGAGNTVGGEIQESESYRIRLRCDTYPQAAIDLIFYVVDYVGEAYIVQLQAQWIIGADPDNPAGTRVWEESGTWDQAGSGWDDWHAAVRQASDFAADIAFGYRSVAGVLGDFSPLDADHDLVDPILGWDGEPFTIPGGEE